MKPLLLALLLFAASSLLLADDNNMSVWINKATTQLNLIEKKLDTINLNQGTDDSDAKLLSQIQGRSQKCIDVTKNNLSEEQSNLKALGEPVAGESNDVAKKRQDLKRQVNLLKNQINACKLIHIQSSTLARNLKEKITQEINRKLFNRGVPFLLAVDKIFSDKKDLNLGNFNAGEWKLFFSDKNLLALIVTTLIIALVIRHLLLQSLVVINPKTIDNFDGFSIAIRACLFKFLPLILPLLALLIYTKISSDFSNENLILHLVYSTSITLGIYLFIRAILNPCKPAQQFLLETAFLAKQLSHYLTLALLLAWASYLLLVTPLKEMFDTNVIYLLRAILLSSLVITFSIILWKIRGYTFALLTSWLRIVIVLILFVSLLAEFLGYRNLSIYLIMGTMGTLLSLAVAIILSRISSDFFDQLDNGNQLWQLQFRQVLNVNKDEHIPGLMWIRLLVVLSIWGGFVFAVLRSWGLSQQSELLLIEGISQGFDIGSFHVVPSRILLAMFIFSLIVGLSRLFKKRIAAPWIAHTRMDKGARDALLTIIGYVSFILAVLFALSIAGIEFKNLAVIAGALSVGIGFGLQNIVNNFVSGLILLFERPIRSGDWIEVGNTRGYVKSINIRSTEIQTFDRAEVIVPNSELISSQVTNWMLHDQIGRLKLSIGVAYGSDIEKVRDILLEIIKNHPDVICDSRFITPPRVLFLEFGDSALNFEMRFFLKEISRRRVVTSDINFAIDKAFREAGIEIPFPQRDIHLKKDA